MQLPFLKVRLAEISFTRSSEPFLTLRLKGTFFNNSAITIYFFITSAASPNYV